MQLFITKVFKFGVVRCLLKGISNETRLVEFINEIYLNLCKKIYS